MTIYNNATKDNINYFSTLTGIPPGVVHAWMNCEGQDDANHSPTNPLNIQYFGSSRPLQIGHHNVTAVYADAHTGLADAWNVLRLNYYDRIRAAIPRGNPNEIIKEIQHSPWAASHYGGIDGVGCIAENFASLVAKGKYNPVTGGYWVKKLPKLKVKALVTTDEKINAQLDAIAANRQYILNLVAAGTTPEDIVPYLDKIQTEANQIATIGLDHIALAPHG